VRPLSVVSTSQLVQLPIDLVPVVLGQIKELRKSGDMQNRGAGTKREKGKEKKRKEREN
jgi:hypothetical protein